MERDLEVTGPIEAEVFFSCDCRDLDIWVHLLDVAPDGTAFNLMSPGLNVVRASYRDAQHGRQLLNLGQIYRLELPHLITSNVFQRGTAFEFRSRPPSFPTSREIFRAANWNQLRPRCRKPRSAYTRSATTVRVCSGLWLSIDSDS